MGVGTEKPFRVMAFSRLALSPIAWNPPPFFTLLPLRFDALRLAAANESVMKSASSDSLASRSGMPSSIRALRSGCCRPAPSSELASLPPWSNAPAISTSFSEAAGDKARMGILSDGVRKIAPLAELFVRRTRFCLHVSKVQRIG